MAPAQLATITSVTSAEKGVYRCFQATIPAMTKPYKKKIATRHVAIGMQIGTSYINHLNNRVMGTTVSLSPSVLPGS